MKTFPFLFLASLLLLAGCNSLNTRIAKEQSQFDAWPAEVQQKIRAERVDIGFTPEQVLVALGEPSKKYSRTTAKGVSEVWSYAGGGWGFSVGVGAGAMHGSGAYGGGVAYQPDSFGDDHERVRIIFEEGVVAFVEKRAK